MKSMLLLLSIIYFSACGQTSNQQTAKNTNETESIKTEKNSIDKEILNKIKKHYQSEFSKDARLEETSSDSILNLVYYSIPKETDDYDGNLIHIYIPQRRKMDLFGANPILYGDLNNDKIEDIIISVHTEGGGGGGNNWSQDIFVFQKINGKYEITCITADGEITGCQNGSFRAKKIKDGFLIGNSSCYNDGDASCCPSLEYVTKVKLINKSLKYNSKALIK